MPFIHPVLTGLSVCFHHFNCISLFSLDLKDYPSIHPFIIYPGSGRRCVLRPEGQSPGQRPKQGNNFETGNNCSIVLPDKMADVLNEQENTHLHPSALKMRQRLQSAPGTDLCTFFAPFSLNSDITPVEIVLLTCLFFLPTRETKISHDCQNLQHSTADWS